MTIDLLAARKDREKKRLDALTPEQREARGIGVTLTIDDGAPVVLPPEFPLEVLKPFLLREFDKTVGVLAVARSAQQAQDIGRELFATNPRILNDVVGAATESLELLFGEDWPRLVAMKPSPQDLIFLIRELAAAYGVGLGEAIGSLASATGDGETSSTTSPPTPAGSTPVPAGVVTEG